MNNPTQLPDLEQVKALFAAWHSTRHSGRERIPENLWAAAIALLESYPISVVCRELRLKPDYLRKRAQANGFKLSPKRKTKQQREFLSLTAGQLITRPAVLNMSGSSATQAEDNSSATSSCRIVLERFDGSRLMLCLPADCLGVNELLYNFLKL
jgi:hypothetical protein